MRLTLVAIGRLKSGVERDLYERYLSRARLAGRPVGLMVEARELDESRARRDHERRLQEAGTIASVVGPSPVLAFDERGAAVDSAGFAAALGRHRDIGATDLALVIGGPDGLDPDVRSRAEQVIAFGAMTWPHQLVRIMAAEQIYRAITILAGHPYHRA